MVEQELQLLLHVCDLDESYCDSSIQIVFAVFISYNLAPKFESFIVLILCRIFAYHTVSMLEQSNQKLLEQYGVEAISQFAQVNRERLTRLAQWGDQNSIRVYIDSSFPLEETGKALDY